MWQDPVLVPDLVSSLCLKDYVYSHLLESTFDCFRALPRTFTDNFTKLNRWVIYICIYLYVYKYIFIHIFITYLELLLVNSFNAIIELELIV